MNFLRSFCYISLVWVMLFAFKATVCAQQSKKVTGKVLSDKGAPLPGTVIVVKGVMEQQPLLIPQATLLLP